MKKITLLGFTLLGLVFALTACGVTATPPPATPTETGAQKKNVLLIKDEQGYSLTDFSGVKNAPLKLPAEMDIITMSPDGRTIAYLPTVQDSKLHNIHLFDIASQSDKILPVADDMMVGPMALSWSPDSHEIAFTCVKVGYQHGLSLCTINVSGAEPFKELVKAETLEGKEYMDGANSPSWSADGKTIAFQSARSPAVPEDGKLRNPIDFWLVDVANGQARRVFVSGTGSFKLPSQPIYVPTENALFFSGHTSGDIDTLYQYNFVTEQFEFITPVISFSTWDIHLSPDGKTFMAYTKPSIDGTDFIPAIFLLDGTLIQQLDALKNIQIISWGEQ